jgi:hypothetical protein
MPTDIRLLQSDDSVHKYTILSGAAMDGENNDVVIVSLNPSKNSPNPAAERKELARLIFRAAELRSQGCSWVTVGRAVDREPETVRKWPRRYAKHWRKVYRFAVSANAIAASAEAMQLLRQEMRGEAPRLRCDSAKAILRHLESRRWRKAKYPKKGLKEAKETNKWKIPVDEKGTTPEQIYEYIQYIESQTPEQLQTLINDLGYKKVEP